MSTLNLSVLLSLAVGVCSLRLAPMRQLDGGPAGMSYDGPQSLSQPSPSHYSKWDRNNLTYRIENYTPDVSEAEVDASIERALQAWAKVTPLTFTRLYDGTADIMISFVYGDHNDNSPFEGPNAYIAHAFPPGQGHGGDVHFNDDKTFSVSSKRGYNLFLVAVHEFGHSLGLSDCNDAGAIMFHTYQPRNPKKFLLNRDDVDRIQALYGRNPSWNDTGKYPVTPNACDSNLVLDAVSNLRGEIFFFKDNFMWRRHTQDSKPEQLLISIFWPQAPARIDAAYESREHDYVLFFRGPKVWAFSADELVSGFPKPISSFGLPTTVKRVDAALYDYESGKTLFFVGKNYYSYDELSETMDQGFPKKVSETFPAVTGKVTAALQNQGFTYLYSGTRVFEYIMGNGTLLQQLDNNFHLPCTNI